MATRPPPDGQLDTNPPPKVQDTDEIAYQPFDDGWSGYDEPSVTLN